ncbi:beta-hexosaminidase subunit beta-like [Eudromia elegans]
MGRAMGLAGLLAGLFLVSAVLVGTSVRHGAPRAAAEPQPELELDEQEPASGAFAEDSPWPLPQSLHTSPRQLRLAPERFQIVHGAGSSAGPACHLLQDAFRRYHEYVFGGSPWRPRARHGLGARAGARRAELAQLQVVVASSDPGCREYPRLESREAYHLTISKPVAVLKADEVWGALRGLETFSQLVHEDDYGSVSIAIN